jgi:hypothetical protein
MPVLMLRSVSSKNKEETAYPGVKTAPAAEIDMVQTWWIGVEARSEKKYYIYTHVHLYILISL